MTGNDQLAAHDVDELRADCGASTRAWAGLIIERATLRDALLASSNESLDRALVARLGALADMIDVADRARVDADAIERAAMHAHGIFHLGEPLSVESTARAIASARLLSRQDPRKKGSSR